MSVGYVAGIHPQPTHLNAAIAARDVEGVVRLLLGKGPVSVAGAG